MTPLVHLDVPLAAARAGTEVGLAREVAHHLATVLRARLGAEVVVTDGDGWLAVGRLTAGDVVVLAADACRAVRPAPALHLLQALPKGRKLDEVVRVATELGVDRVVPVAAARVVTRLEGDRAERARQRWQAVARAACEQSRRVWRPEVAPVTSVATAVAEVIAGGGSVLVAHPGAPALPAALARAGRVGGPGDPAAGSDGPSAAGSAGASAAGSAGVPGVGSAGASAAGSDGPPVGTPGAWPVIVALVVGPEGGWTDAEVADLVAIGAIPVGLGPTVLRTEHAGAAGLAVLAALLGRWEPRPEEVRPA